MATTYIQPINAVQIVTTMGIMVGALGADANAAEMAYNQKKTITAKDSRNVNVVLVPYHAVQVFMKATTTEEATKEDPYCDDGGESGGKCVEIWSGSADISNDNDGELPYYYGSVYTPSETPKSIRLTIDGVKYEEVDGVEVSEYVYTYGNYPFTESVPFKLTISINPNDKYTTLLLENGGTHSIVVEGCN